MLLWFGLAPWLFTVEVALYLVMVILVELEFYKRSVVLLIVGLIATHYFHVFSIVEAFRNHFVVTLSCILGYFPCGSIWMVFKWLLFLHKFNDARREALDEFHDDQERARARIEAKSPYSRDEEVIKQTDAQVKKLIEYLEGYSRDEEVIKQTDRECLAGKLYKNTSLLKAPRIRDYKAKVAGWVCLWVFSVVGTIFHDLARHISLWIYNRFSGLLQWMSDKVVGDVPEPVLGEKVTDDAKP
jgi:hypothetical protein